MASSGYNFSMNEFKNKLFITVVTAHKHIIFSDFHTDQDREIYWTLINYAQQFFASDRWEQL